MGAWTMTTITRGKPFPWSLGKTTPRKRIHRTGCRYARTEYVWAGDRTEDELFAALCESGAFRWHDAGECCSYRLRVLLDRARLEAAS